MLVLLTWQVLLPGFVGLANNGDFPKVAGRLSLGSADHGADDFLFFQPDYLRSPQFYWNAGLISSEHLLAGLASAIEKRFGDRTRFDIRWLGALHLLGWMLGYLALLRALRGLSGIRWWIAAIVSVWIFADVCYVSYLNSFFMDTAALLGGLAMMAMAPIVMAQRRASQMVAFGAAALLFVTSKSQHSLFAVLPVVFLLFVAAKSEQRISRAAGFVIAGLIAATGCWVATSTPDWYRNQPRFNLIFFKILPQSATPEKDARELGLAPSDLRFVGIHAFSPGSPAADPAWLQAFGTRGSYANVARFYVRHPAIPIRFMWRNIVEELWLIRANNLSNFPRSAGKPAGALTNRMATWSDARSWMFVHWPSHIVLWYALVLIGGAVALRRGRLSNDQRGIAGAVLFAAMLGAGEFCLATLADTLETYRHLLVFQLCTDVTIFWALVLALSYARATSLAAARPVRTQSGSPIPS